MKKRMYYMIKGVTFFSALGLVILLGFNNCGEGFTALDMETGEFLSSLEPPPPLVKFNKHISIAKEPLDLGFEEAVSLSRVSPDLYYVSPLNPDNPSLGQDSVVYYGSFKDFKNKSYKTLEFPDFKEAGAELKFISLELGEVHGSLLLNAHFNTDKLKNRVVINYKYENVNGELKPSFVFSNEDNHLNKMGVVSKNWNFYFQADENRSFIRNSQTGEEISVLEKESSYVIISDDEKWYISKGSDELCRVTHFTTEKSYSLGPINGRDNCSRYKFLTNDIILHTSVGVDINPSVYNYYNDSNFNGWSYTLRYNQNSANDDVTWTYDIIDYKNSKKINVSSNYFTFDKSKKVIGYLGEDGQYKKQYLNDFINSYQATVSYNKTNLEKFLNLSAIASFSVSFADHFQYLWSSELSLFKNDNTGQVISVGKILSSPRQSFIKENNRYFVDFFDGNYYLKRTSNANFLYKIDLVDSSVDHSLPEYDCEIKTTVSNKLSETCLLDLIKSGKKYKNFFEYSVNYELETQGANEKNRWVYIPPGKNINNADEDNWVYPKGTILYKNFARKQNVLDKTTFVNFETRVLEKVTDGVSAEAWRASLYVWNEDQTDATSTEDGADIKFKLVDQEYTYKVPKVSSCTQCHIGDKDMVAGFNQFQLNSGFHKYSILDSYYEDGLLAQAPKESEYISDSNTRYAIGSLHANCAGCHSPKGSAAFMGLDFTFKHGVTDVKQTNAYLTGVSSGRMKPGDAEGSRVYKSVEAGTMPKGALYSSKNLSTQIKTWINGLEP